MVKKNCWVKYVAKIYLLTEFQKSLTKNEEMMANFHFFFQNAILDQCALPISGQCAVESKGLNYLITTLNLISNH